MCLTLPDTLISLVGIEKVLPSYDDLEIFLKLLPRSATGERMNPYNSVWSGVTPNDGPQEQHVIFMDNGRTNVLADPVGREVLRCIRCASCINVCPVYERAGGHAYGSVYPGPIGITLTPQLRGIDDPVDRTMPYACSLCGACNEVCPVKIPFTDIIVHLRNRVADAERKELSKDVDVNGEKVIMKAAAWVLGDYKHWETVMYASRSASRVLGPHKIGPLPVPVANRWLDYRNIDHIPSQTFRDWWKANRGEEK